MSRKVFFLMLQVILLQAIEWNSPTQLFSGASLNGTWTKVAAHPNQDAAEAAWIVHHDDGATDIYTASCSNGTWATAQTLSSSSYPRTSLGLVVDASATYSLVCEVLDGTAKRIEAAYNSMGSWSTLTKLPAPTTLTGCFSLHLAVLDPDTAVVSWIDPSGTFQALAYESGASGTPYPISESGLIVRGTQTAVDQAIFTTANKTYSSDLILSTPLKNTLLLHRAANTSSLCVATRADRHIFAFQDSLTNFFLSVVDQIEDLSYSLIAAPTLPISSAQLAIHPSSDEAAVIWQLSNGSIYVSRFHNKKWGVATLLSSNGSNPNILIDPTTGNPFAIWADLTAGGTSNAIQCATWNGSSWSTSTISATGLTFSYVDAKINSEGNAVLIWCRQPTADDENVVEATTSRHS